MLVITSDQHFGCENLVRNTRPKFSSIEEHDEHLIVRCNAKAKKNDTLIMVGDLCHHDPLYWRACLDCKDIRFVLGNHDAEKEIRRWFKHVYHYKSYRTPNGSKIWFSHYPTAFWEGSHKGWYHGYGHVHGRYEQWLDTMMPGRRSIDVSVDNANKLLGDYEPFTIAEILGLIGDRPGHEIIKPEDRWAAKDYS